MLLQWTFEWIFDSIQNLLKYCSKKLLIVKPSILKQFTCKLNDSNSVLSLYVNFPWLAILYRMNSFGMRNYHVIHHKQTLYDDRQFSYKRGKIQVKLGENGFSFFGKSTRRVRRLPKVDVKAKMITPGRFQVEGWQKLDIFSWWKWR